MKTYTIIIFTFLLTISFIVNAQNYAFKVLANKGANEVRSGESWQPLRTGLTLKSGDEVKLTDNAYIGLVHSSGKPVELKEAGIHKISELEKSVGTGSSVLNKYTDFILSSNSSEGKNNRLNATGAVHRALETSAIKIFLPDNQDAGIFNDKAIIRWDGSSVQGPYIVTLKNMFEDVLAKEETARTSYEIDLGEEKYVNENAILIEISSKADPKLTSSQHLIKKLSPAEQQKVSMAFKEINSEVKEGTPLNNLILAGFYEENHLLIDAIYAYEQAIKIAPDVPTFKETYDEFLLRNHLK